MVSNHFDLFPTSRAIPEAQQIGRKPFIDRVEAAATSGSNVLLLHDRRTGKSSVARAVIERLTHRAPVTDVALMVDLSEMQRSQDLAKALLDGAREQKALRAFAAAKLAAGRQGREAKGWFRQKGAAAGDALMSSGVPEGEIAAALSELLPEGTGQSVRAILEALDEQARQASGGRVVIFIDEIQELATWADAAEVKSAIARVSSKPEHRVNFIFAGSKTSAVEGLFSENDPLEFFGNRMELPEISTEQWITGLAPRFKEAGLLVSRERLAQIVVGTDGHPLKTMQVCWHLLEITEGEEITQIHVELAIGQQRSHPGWRNR